MATEYIERGEAIDALKKDVMGGLNYRRILNSIPATDVQPVKHGKNLKEEYPTLFQCSVCGCEDWDTSEVNYGEYNYCPNCGAKMDGAE